MSGSLNNHSLKVLYDEYIKHFLTVLTSYISIYWVSLYEHNLWLHADR